MQNNLQHTKLQQPNPSPLQKNRKKSNDSESMLQIPNSSRTFGKTNNKIIIHYEKNQQNNGSGSNINVNINMKMNMNMGMNQRVVSCVLLTVFIVIMIVVSMYGYIKNSEGIITNKAFSSQLLALTSTSSSLQNQLSSSSYDTAQLQSQLHQIPTHQSIICIVFSFNSEQYLKHTLQSLIKYNQYPFQYTIAIIKNIPSKDLAQKYPHIIWMTGQYNDDNKMYQSLDKILKQYDSEYVFIVDDQWIFVEGQFIEDSVRVLKKYDDIGQLLLIDQKMMKDHRRRQRMQEGQWMGFSWTPGLHRRKDLWDYQGKFQALGKEVEKNMGSIQKLISKEFVESHRIALGNGKIYAKGMYSSTRFTIINEYDQKVRAEEIKKQYPGS